MNGFGDSAGIQTLDLQNRNLTLYSAKLRSHLLDCGAKVHIIWESHNNFFIFYCFYFRPLK